MYRLCQRLAPLLLLAPCARARTPAPPSSDTSPHTIKFASVQPYVRLEVLDCGGTGPAMTPLIHGDSHDR